MRASAMLTVVTRYLTEGVVRLGWAVMLSPHSREDADELASWLSLPRNAATGIAEIEDFLRRAAGAA